MFGFGEELEIEYWYTLRIDLGMTLDINGNIDLFKVYTVTDF